MQEEAALSLRAPLGILGRHQLPCWHVQEVEKRSSGRYSEKPEFLCDSCVFFPYN
jgi:hypothetical protein